ncbi:MAG: hypothetical protein U5S82_07060 [Gammaproteobacteria bacterium]|nr:hypothetical protein [Gammaproteobacteria bacterium]
MIANERLLKPKDEAAARALAQAFEQASQVRQGVLDTLLTRDGDKEMFRLVYPFSPALVQTLVVVSSLLQRERTALKLMQQLLVDRREGFQLGQIIPVGDLFDVVSEGDEPFSQVIRAQFETAKRLYREKLRPHLEMQHGVTEYDVARGAAPEEKPAPSPTTPASPRPWCWRPWPPRWRPSRASPPNGWRP